MYPVKQNLKATAFILMMTSFTAHAIVNVEGLRTSKTEDGFAGSADFLLGGKSGNTDKSSLDITGRLNWTQEKTTDLLILNYAYGRSNNTRDTNKALLHLRHTLHISGKRAVEGFTQIEQDEFARLSFRGLLGGGVRQTLAKSKDDQRYIGLGLFYTWEQLEQRANFTDDGRDKFWRANSYFVIHKNITDDVTFTSTSYFQPTLKKPSDFRLLEQAGLKIHLIDNIKFRASLEITYDSEPPQTIEKMDVSYKTGIEYQF